jgi:predicted ABC-type ATPase
MKIIREYIRLLIEQKSSPKVIFMAGGPGSGKSTVIRKLGLKSRLEVINPDDHYEKFLKKEDIPMNREYLIQQYIPLKKKYEEAVNSEDLESIKSLKPEFLKFKNYLSRSMTLFNKARKISKERKQEKINLGQSYLVDGTGGNYKQILNQVKKLKDLGYKVGMVFIDVPKETSVERDRSRGNIGKRSIGQKSVERSWQAVDSNKELYKNLFKDEFFYIDASEKNFEDSIERVSSSITSFLS